MDEHARPVTWMVSSYDLTSHAFRDLGDIIGFSEALCSHSVPTDRVVGERGEKRCIACLLIHGGDLADRGGDPGGWTAQ